MSYSRWSNSRWYTFWSAMGAESTEYRWPTQKLKDNQVFEICDMPSYFITYGDLIHKSRSKVLKEVKDHFSQDSEWTDMEGTTHVSKSVPPTWEELMELQEYFSRFIKDVDDHFKLWNFMKYEWYYPFRNKIYWKIKKLKKRYVKDRSK